MALTDRLLLPLASETDARNTVDAFVSAFAGEPPAETIIPLHIIEKGGGSIDKLPVDTQKEQAEALFTVAIDELEAAGYATDPEVVYATDVVDAITGAAMELEATAIVFLPREGGRLSRLLAGDLSNRLLSQTPVPVIVLPRNRPTST